MPFLIPFSTAEMSWTSTKISLFQYTNIPFSLYTENVKKENYSKINHTAVGSSSSLSKVPPLGKRLGEGEAFELFASAESDI